MEQQNTTSQWQTQKAAPDLGPRRFFLAFHCGADVKVIELSEGQSAIVGRAFPSELILNDPSLSRQHARFRCDKGAIYVQDLGSRNGVLIRDEKVSDSIVSPGDALALGGVTVVVYNVGLHQKCVRDIATYDSLLGRLDDEIVRSRQFQRSFSVAMIRSAASIGAYVTQFWSQVRDSLRPIDTLAPYGASSSLVLLPETSAAEAYGWADSLVRNSGDVSELQCGLATYPFAGTTAEKLIASAHEACRSATKKNRINSLAGEAPFVDTKHGEIVVRSEKMREVQRLIARVAKSPIVVLIQGETGVGKELVALSIHHLSDRKHKGFKAVNCAAIPNTLIESTLFGHERGAFTGAHKTSPGVFEQANEGTIFLDEIGELSALAQAALLRVIETKRLVRIGGSREKVVDIRIVAATHCDLDAMAERGTFRQDLLYRLNTVVIKVPPLRERLADIEPIIDFFIRKFRREWDRPHIKIHADALSALLKYSWPGNVRQLRNTIERAIVVCPSDTIHITDLPGSVLSPASEGQLSRRLWEGEKEDVINEAKAGLKEQTRTYEVAAIREALRRAQGKRKIAAELLHMPLRTLSYKISIYGIENS
jgi:DNA-binding NtrC family response regulator